MGKARKRATVDTVRNRLKLIPVTFRQRLEGEQALESEFSIVDDGGLVDAWVTP
ncbi:hypothetical protein M413DRAFT_443745 [Hebeloma cylindrosporum]|uniref:Uncharacterized protein n=1 Tax=Hebeloma cylindrosporum TaxID=76867 RepID=A0A0C2YS57_HEBCY|nr:hypothetical protein M413DRAFT_443745 [Hebeloma cylindrosporum h7]